MLRCPACPERDSCKPFPQPTGPKHARVCIIGEGPATDEYRQGRVFAGKTGQELDGQYLPLAGLDRDNVYVTNASKCAGRTKQGGIDNPSNAQARACWAYFSQFELREVQPEVIVVMGAIAADAVLGPGVDMEMQHGIPIQRPFTHEWPAPLPPAAVVPVYHPAAGLHDTKWMIALQDDFRRLRKLVRGDFSDVVTDPYPEPAYLEVASVSELVNYFNPLNSGLYDAQVRNIYASVDTEYTDAGVWCVTVSAQAGTGILVPAAHVGLIEALRAVLADYCLVFHNALADLPQVQSVGLHPRRWTDTMRDAYWLNEFRIGLKPLAYRYLGMRMHDYTDVTGPPSKLKLYAYLESAIAGMREAVPASRKTKGMTEDEMLIRKAAQLCGRLVGDLEKDAATGFSKLKPWDRIDDWRPEVTGAIAVFGGGKIPRQSIEHVERATAVQYACRDADATLRLRPVLAAKMRELRRTVA